MMDSTGSRAARKRKLSDGGPSDPRYIKLIIHAPEEVMDRSIENIEVRRNRTWVECLQRATNLQVTHWIKANYVIRPKSDNQGKYAQSLNSEVGTLADTLGSNKQFLEVVVCRKFLPEEDKRTTAKPTSSGESRRRSRRDSRKEAPSTSIDVSVTDTRCRAVPGTSREREPRTPANEAKEKTSTWFQSFPKGKSNRKEDGGKRLQHTNLDELTDLANELELPLEIVEHYVPAGGPSKRGDATSKWCVKIGEGVFTQKTGKASSATRGKVIKTALGEMRKLKHKLSFAKILQTDSTPGQGSSDGDNSTSVFLLTEIAKRQGLTTKFEILEAECSQHNSQFTGDVTIGYSFEGTGASKKAAKISAAKAALIACAVQKPTPPTGGGNLEPFWKGWQTSSVKMTAKTYGAVSRSSVTPNNEKSPPPPHGSSRENIDTLKLVSKLRGMPVTYTDFEYKHGYLSIASIANPPNATHGYHHSLEAARNIAAGKMIHAVAHTKG